MLFYHLTHYQVAYHGTPKKAYEVFVNALQSNLLSQGVPIPQLEDRNPAGGGTLFRNHRGLQCSIILY